MSYFNNHTHTMYSNIRILDCINKPIDLINTAIKLGLSGIAITDHECLSSHMEINEYAEELRKTNPDFTIAFGNEIYLTETRNNKQQYFHFILIAKNKQGYRALKELSSIAWYNLYVDRGMERVPTLKNELSEVVNKFKGTLIATSGCLGGELPTLVNALVEAENSENQNQIFEIKTKINDFIAYCLNLFGEDFYIEIAPAESVDQIKFNQRVINIAKAYGIKIVIGTDAHYLQKKDRYVHKSYLKSKEGEREVDAFYEYTYLMNEQETIEHLKKSYDQEFIKEIFENSQELQGKISFYSLREHQSIPEVKVKDYLKQEKNIKDCPTLNYLFNSDNIQERYWVNQCFEGLKEKQLINKSEYINRLEEEAKVKKIIGEKLQTCMFAYPNTLQHYIDLFWECGSPVGAGRGSSCAALNHYLLGVTQLDPIEWNLPFFRYLNEERIELGDIDLDLAPSKLPAIFEAIRKERGELGIVQVCTFGTESTKSCVLSACRGYRSDEYPNGIEPEEAQYISSLVPIERGFVYSLSDLLFGNPEKDRKPNKTFINAINQYPGLKEIMLGIENLVCRRGIHASGVILFDENIYDTTAIMRAPNGALTTQWDLHQVEKAGAVKYDFLLTSVQDIIVQTIQLLQKDNIIESELNLRQVYNKYLHPSVIPQNDKKMWEALANNEVLCCFQFDSPVGAEAAKKIRPTTPLELADANGLMRLMASEPGAETPIDKYVRFKKNISLWYQEMDNFGLTKKEQKILEPYFKSSYGVPPSQEQLMLMLMDKNICGFSLAESNSARKIVAKKQMDKIPALHEKIVKQASSERLGQYVWKYGAGPQMGYSFSIIHALAYSFIALQTLYLATHFNPIYWDTACLIVNSGSLDDSSTDYVKVAKAIGTIQQANIQMSLVNINKSELGFIPDTENNRIMFGLKGLANVGEEVIQEIISKRPYNSPKDFLYRANPKRQVMISLIKGGAFDEMMDRKLCMGWYLWETCDKKKRVTLQNLPGLIKYKLLPENKEEEILARRIYEFNRYLKAVCKDSTSFYQLDERAMVFLTEIDQDGLIQEGNKLDQKTWDKKVYQPWMDVFRNWISENKDEILTNLNNQIFLEDWNKYAKGNYSSWEMETLCFYYHEHELANINTERYGLYNFNQLPEEPIVERSFNTKDGKQVNIFKLYRICGTCIAKNKNKGTVTLLTPDGIAEVKWRREYFGLFDKQISEKQPDGTKKIIEKSWFNRGSMIIVQGFRSGNNFIPKKYSTSPGHQLYKITEVLPNGELVLQDTRHKGDLEDED